MKKQFLALLILLAMLAPVAIALAQDAPPPARR